MPKEHLSNDEFLQRLSELFEQRRTKDHGSVFLTQKRMIYGDCTAAAAPESTNSQSDQTPSKPIPILIRATDGKSKKERDEKIKLSTVVQPEALEIFFVRYAEVCKLGMSGLKKRNRSKAKEKQKAKKKKLGAGTGAGVVGDIKKA